jgi:photosystem II stability/assembly factor-like uncharacterized protein/sulfur carrier protein ThiS
MATVILPPTLKSRARNLGKIEIDAATAGEVLRQLEQTLPDLKGWILDETGSLREHVALFVNDQRVSLSREIESGDQVYVVQAISGGSGPIEAEVLLGTKKGLFVLRGIRGSTMDIATRLFAGQTVDYACFDNRSETYFAAVSHGQFGPQLDYTDDPVSEWTEVDGLAFPETSEKALERVWIVQPGEAPGLLWAGVAPAALFRSVDNGRTWELDRGLWEQPTRPDWEGGLGGLALHSICPWPGKPERLAVGISAVGVWTTEDGGSTWSRGVEGLVPRYLPEEARAGTLMHCIHKMLRAAKQPDTLYLQFHGGVYRSDDAGRTWLDIGTDSGLPADFGFPLALDPGNPDRAFVIPLVADVDRVTPDGKLRVFETQDRGTSWSSCSEGLPDKDAYHTILRQAFCVDGQEPLGLYFGTESGDLFGSIDAEHWLCVKENLPKIVSVQSGKLSPG